MFALSLALLHVFALAATSHEAMAAKLSPDNVMLAGWPDVSGLTARDGPDGSWILYASGVEIATVPAGRMPALFDLVPGSSCETTEALGKVVSALLTLGSEKSIQRNRIFRHPFPDKISDLTEEGLMAVELQVAGTDMPVHDALLALNTALDAEIWRETPPRILFTNDLTKTLKAYLTRAKESLAQDPPTLSGFAKISKGEIDRIPGTLKSEGMAFDGASPVFSWRYGLQRTDPRYRPLETRPLAIPAEIQAAHYDSSMHNGFSHIGDIDIANGTLYAPIEDEDNQTKPFVALFDPKTLIYAGEAHELPTDVLPHGVPWVAVDPKRGVFYTVDWESQDLQVFSLSAFSLVRTVPLKYISSSGETRMIRRIQGAKVRDGFLYASSDSHDDAIQPDGSTKKRKYLYKIDPVSGGVLEIAHFDEPNLSETEGLAFGPDGTLHVIVLAPYFYDMEFPPKFEVNGDDWNPSMSLAQFNRSERSLRRVICTKK